MEERIIKLIDESLRDWFGKEDWVRINSSGEIAGKCGTSKNKKNPDSQWKLTFLIEEGGLYFTVYSFQYLRGGFSSVPEG